MTETDARPALDRRAALKALFGLAAVAAGAGAVLMPVAAEAAPRAADAPRPEAPREPTHDEPARDSDLPASEPTQYYYYRRRYYRPRRRYYYRPRRVYRRRYVRRVYYY